VRALAGVIRRCREQLGLSQNQLAKRSGVTRPMIGLIESDDVVPTVQIVACLAEGLGIPYGRLNLGVDEWFASQPAFCRACKYICIGGGELKRLTVDRKCNRPVKDSPGLADCPPVSP